MHDHDLNKFGGPQANVASNECSDEEHVPTGNDYVPPAAKKGVEGANGNNNSLLFVQKFRPALPRFHLPTKNFGLPNNKTVGGAPEV